MTLSTSSNRSDYTGNDTTAIYNYTYRIFQESELLAIVQNISTGVETTLAITTDYTVSGVGDVSGGSITLVGTAKAWQGTGSNLDSGYELVIKRVVALTQETDIRNQGDFYPEVHEDQFDKLTMIDQQQQEELDRAVKLADSTAIADLNPSLPADLPGSASVCIVTNVGGTAFEVGPTTSEISNAQSNAVAAAASAAAASISESNAATSESNAAASASAAAINAAASLWVDTEFKAFGDSPITVVDGDVGKLIVVDCTSGNVVVNLPSIAALTLTGPWTISFKKSDTSSNTITINRNGTDTIDGGTSVVVSRAEAGIVLVPDTDASPDEWTSMTYGEVPISGDLVGTTDTQTLTNKTFDDAITHQEVAAPGTPASGYAATYFKTDSKPYYKNDAGTEVGLAGLAATETFTNKTFDDEIVMKEIASPSNPASGYQSLFVDSADNGLTLRDSSGTEKKVTTMQIAYISEEQTSGTDGGTSTSTTNHTRVLNTVAGDTSIVSLSSNQFTLQAGTYEIRADAPCFSGTGNRVTIYNTTDSTIDLYGTTEYAGTGNVTMSRSEVNGKLDLASAKTFELRHYIKAGRATDGLGTNVGDGTNPEVFSRVQVVKLS